ncbi:unnamed protein product [Protopolystoma xenopodis]|uniref:Uncharacterized protein n=1 Tax=Protopolystoma xenopodis TaxID=117903 RepID=A0A3S5CRA6_9PLAT|nr:unnamed protein product [Protopolystoma xenopodis]
MRRQIVHHRPLVRNVRILNQLEGADPAPLVELEAVAQRLVMVRQTVLRAVVRNDNVLRDDSRIGGQRIGHASEEAQVILHQFARHVVPVVIAVQYLAVCHFHVHTCVLFVKFVLINTHYSL